MDRIIVAYIKLIPVLIEAVKEHEEIITELSAKVQDLEKEHHTHLRGACEDTYFLIKNLHFVI